MVVFSRGSCIALNCEVMLWNIAGNQLLIQRISENVSPPGFSPFDFFPFVCIHTHTHTHTHILHFNICIYIIKCHYISRWAFVPCFQNEWLFLRASARTRTLLNFHCLRVPKFMSSEIPFWNLHFPITLCTWGHWVEHAVEHRCPTAQHCLHVAQMLTQAPVCQRAKRVSSK